MTEAQEQYDWLVHQWQQRHRAWPSGWHAVEEHGLDVLMLEEFEQRLNSFVQKRHVSPSVAELLKTVTEKLATIVPHLPRGTRDYFDDLVRFGQMAVAVLRADADLAMGFVLDVDAPAQPGLPDEAAIAGRPAEPDAYWDALARVEEQWALIVTAEPRELESKLNRPPPGTVVRAIDAARCASEGKLLREFARGLELPSNIGHNWDALDECVTGLEWIPSTAYVLLLRNAPALVARAPLFAAVVNVLSAAALNFRSPATDTVTERPKAFHVLWSCKPDEVRLLNDALRSANVTARVIPL